MTKKRLQLGKIKRDTAIVTFAIVMSIFEITLGGGRTSVLTFLGGIFISPIIMRAEERNKNGQ